MAIPTQKSGSLGELDPRNDELDQMKCEQSVLGGIRSGAFPFSGIEQDFVIS